MATVQEAFPYPPLPINEDAIRILTVEAGEFSEPLICTLIPTTFGAKPIYVALSYTWADSYPDNVTLPTTPCHDDLMPHLSTSIADFSRSQEDSLLQDGEQTPSTESNHNQSQTLSTSQHARSSRPSESQGLAAHIMLNGRPFHIQHNLYLALLHLRSLTHPLTLWIDSICINQTNTSERSSQVAMMSFIYTRALKVVAWLGIREYRNRLNVFRSMANDWKAGQGQKFAPAVSGTTKFRSSLEPDRKTLVRLAESAYWTRLWVAQEVSLPRMLVFLYGSKIWTCEDLRQWETLKAARSRPLSPNSAEDGRRELFGAMLRLLDTRDARYSEALNLESLIERFQKNACSELRDRVYGLLGLANDAQPFSGAGSSELSIDEPFGALDIQFKALNNRQRAMRMFKVDYSRSFYDIWTDVVKFFYFQKENIAGCHNDADADLEIERRVTMVRAAGIVQEALDQQVEKGASSLKFVQESPSFTFLLNYSLQTNDTENHQAIHRKPPIRVVGFLCSKIIQLGPSYSSFVASFRAQQEWLSCWETHYHTPGDLELLREKNGIYTSKILAFSNDDLSRIREIRSAETVAWHVAEGNRPATSDPSYAVEYGKAWGTDQRQGNPNSPRICLGTEHLIATVPPSAKAGDVIVRFWNCSAAIVMRPVPTSIVDNRGSLFMLIGRADVMENSFRVANPESDSRAWNRVESGFETGARVYVDLDLRTLQIITAAIST